jgi:hypothetical protein
LTGFSPSTSFSGSNAGDDLPLVDLRRGGQLDQDAVDRRIEVEAVDQRGQRLWRSVGGQAVLEALHASRHRRLALVADIDLARGVLADQHHGQPRRATGFGPERRDALRHARAQAGRKRLSVDDPGAHAASGSAATAR